MRENCAEERIIVNSYIIRTCSNRMSQISRKFDIVRSSKDCDVIQVLAYVSASLFFVHLHLQNIVVINERELILETVCERKTL